MMDVEQSVEKEFKPKKWRQFLPAIVASHGTLALGMILGWSSPAVPTFTKDEFGLMEIDQKSWIVSLPLLGAFCSALPASYILKKMGPRKLIMGLCIPLGLGWLQILCADSIRMLYFARFILGFAAGPYLLAVPVYIAEISSDDLRGHLSTMTLGQLVHGILFAYIKGYFVNWKMLSLAMTGIPIILLIAMYFLPDSPGFLFSQGKETEGIAALKWFRGASDVTQIESEVKLLKISRSKSFERGHKVEMGLKDWFEGPIRTPLLICLGLMLIQQWSGMWVIVMYTVDIFDKVSILDLHKINLSSNVETIIVGIALVLGLTVSGLLVKKVDKKILMIASCMGTALCWMLLGIFFHLKFRNSASGKPSPDGLEFIPIIAMTSGAFLYSLGLGTVPWQLLDESIPSNLKGTATGLIVSCNWLASFILIKSYQKVASSIGIFTLYWIFTAICVSGALYTQLILPKLNTKTSQKSLNNFDSQTQIQNQSAETTPM